MPGSYYNLSQGEKMVIRAFFEFDMQCRTENKENEEFERRINKLRSK